jgi:hypothetical protein
LNIISLQHDYHLISLTSLGAPVKVIEVPIIDYRVVEGMDGVMELDDIELVGSMVTEEEMVGVFMTETVEMTSDMVEEEPMDGVFVVEEEMVGTFDPEC